MGSSPAIAYVDGTRMLQALTAGSHHLFRQREHLNDINVFPVPDGDTGTNLVFTFRHILETVAVAPPARLDELLAVICDAAMDGARGNSGAIMAQYLQGISDSINGVRLLNAVHLAEASQAGATAAWKAMSKPVAGTLPTVLQDFSEELVTCARDGESDIREMLAKGLQRARISLANTPNQLAVLKQAGVVDAGAQGFVDLLEGIWLFIERGVIDQDIRTDESEGASSNAVKASAAALADFDNQKHRYCTECVLEGDSMDREALMNKLQALDASSLVVAGGKQRIRVHIHVNNPAAVYLLCENFGEIKQQKADDMARQHGLLNHTGSVVVVTDSGGDIPSSEVERLGIHVVPVRLSFGDIEYLDGVSLNAEAFYPMLTDAKETPLTSQPPVQDFSRVYSLLTSHGYSVISVGLSEQLSGTTTSARLAASDFDGEQVRVIDSLSATCGEGLLAILAAEAAANGMSADEVEALMLEMIPRTRVFALCDDLIYAVRGGRVPSWMKQLVNMLRINPVLTASPKGQLKPAGFVVGVRSNPVALAKLVTRKMKNHQMVRVLISHANCLEKAHELRKAILERHQQVHSCHITNMGPALGVHIGTGGIVVGFAPQPECLEST